MKLNQKMITQLETFLTLLEQTTYPEPPTEGIGRSMKQVIAHIQSKFPGAFQGRILDIGCGQGQAIEIFAEMGLQTTGITLNNDDLEICRQKKFDVRYMDMSFLEFEDEEFDFIWCRHCIEHSFMPFFTLFGFYRVLKKGGFAYVEVPAPDTEVGHQTNKNHFSVLGKSMWSELIIRSGFFGENIDLDIKTLGGQKDIYWGFIIRKPE
ncbi:MAG: class I SAM-dependent methyltransferase [Deltaproteobacteria bacterium]|nr:class I SAM-dependent methyltransferase [Deltaproteobacteria bacterium]